MITAEQLKVACPSLTTVRAIALLPLLIGTCEKYGISKQSLPFFLANLIHESGGFTIKVENLTYTTATRLIAVWPSRFSIDGSGGKAKASLYLRNPEGLAELSYGGRMGNVKGTKDSYIFRGGGFAQITGRDAYQQYLQHLASQGRAGTFTPVTLAATVQTIDLYSMDSAGWFFSVFKKLNTTFDFKTVCKRWNGALIGFEDRKKYFQRIISLI